VAWASLRLSPVVAVVGGGAAPEEDLRRAYRVGELIGSAGAVLVCGGLGGVMAEACRGAAGAGGLTVGILPGLDPAAANPWVRLALPTGLGEARNALVVAAAQAVVAVGGEYGTLSEIALALRSAKAVVGLGTWGLLRPDGNADPLPLRAASPEEAVAMALGACGRS